MHTAMGRKVIHNSPPKHPEQDDPYAQMDRDLEKALQGTPAPGTLERARKAMQPAQQPSAKPAQAIMDYIKKFGGGK